MTRAIGMRRRSAPRVLLLALLVLAQFLCSVCHTSVAAADTPPAVAHAAPAHGPAEPPETGPVPHGTGGAESTLLCHGDGDSSADQRAAAGQVLVLLGVGAAVLAAFRIAPRRPHSWLVRAVPAPARSGARLLVSLCIQRV
ncbi:hypothetical protein [Murinocardiopsis flavida]|uniref:hypothetical protein n=1 Tax=Murinocardiopsis flavida TaxID=645275 RepID=UPI0011B2999F|nr:hypothetical protein [Murinocardiopsis flavida]